MEIETALAFTDTLVFAKVGTHLSDLQQAMLRSSWSMQRQSYDQIAETYGYSASYLKHDVGPKLWKLLSEVLGEKVTKTSFRTAIERRYQQSQQSAAGPAVAAASRETPSVRLYQDWGSAAEIGSFYGREAELAQLQQWVEQDRCLLIAVLGMGGIGKTSLMLKLARRLVETADEADESAFTHVIWRSLRNAPPIQTLLADLLHFLSNQQEVSAPETVAGQLDRLLHYLRTQRCLIVLDNVETVLQTASQPIQNENDQGYRDLWQQVGETLHQSCLLLTSREKPRAVALLEGAASPVRTLALHGLPTAVGQQLLQFKGEFLGSEADWQRLVEGYSGNPLALKMIATTIQTLFDGSIADFLQQNTYVFGTIRSLLEQQLDRLASAEKTVLLELAINREPSSFAQLRADVFPLIEPQALIEVLENLEQRSLLEKVGSLFSLQPVVMEYLTERLVTTVTAELQALSGVRLLRSHALLKTQAKDYVRDTQIRLILQPILSRLAGGDLSIAEILQSQMIAWRGKSAMETGYAAGNVINLLLQHQPRLQDWDLSALAIGQADFRSVGLKNVNLMGSQFSQSLFTETLGIVFAVAFTSDGSRLITGDAEGGLRVWQMKDGQLLLNLEGHQGWVWAVAVSRSGELLASCSSDKTIRLWQVSSGDCLQILRGHTGTIWSIAFSADGKWLASGGDESTIYLWNVKTGQLQRTLTGQTGRILSLAFSPNVETPVLVSGSSDGTVRFWQLADATFSELTAHVDRVWSVAFSPQGDWFASGSADATIKLWQMQPPSSEKSQSEAEYFQVSAGERAVCRQVLSEHRDRVRSLAFSPDGEMLVSGSDDQLLRLWQVESGQCLQVFGGHGNSIFSVTFNPDNQTLASGSADQTVRFWNTQTGRCLKTLKGYTNSIFSLAYSPDGQTLASGSTDQVIRLWNRDCGQFQTLEGHQGWVTSVAFHPHEPRLVSASADQTVRLWSIQTGQCLQIFQGHTNWVQSVSFSPDGSQIASGGDDRLIRIWSVATGQCLQVLQGHTSWVWAVRFSPDGTCIASSSDDQTIRLWLVQTGECLQVLQGHTGQIQSIAFSPDSEMLISGSADETVRLWSVQTGNCLQVLHGHENNVWAVAFSPDGTRAASGSLDQTVRVWDVQQGRCLQVLSVANQSVRSSLAFHPVAAQLATGSRDGTIQLWDWQTGTNLQTLRPDRPYQGTNITGVTGITPAQKASLKRLGAIEL